MSEKEEKVSGSMVIDVNDTITHAITFERYENNKSVVLEPQDLSNVGRYLTLRLTVKNVAPNK